MEEYTINVQVGQREYPVKIRKDEEENVRKAAQIINDKISEYQKQYAVNDKVDLMTMCALQIASELVSNTEIQERELKSLSGEIEFIDQAVTGLLKNVH